MADPVAPPQGGKPNLPVAGQPAPMQPGEFAPGSVANITTFGFDKVSPPSTLYVQRDDQLILETASQQGIVETVRFTTRLLRVPEPQGGQPEQGGVGQHPGQIITRGIIEPAAFDLPGLANRALARRIVQMQEGYLLSVVAGATAAIQRGQTWVRAYLLRGVTNISPLAQNAAQILLSDYTYIGQPIGWPGGRQMQSVESMGFRHSIQVANPAAGTDWTFTAAVQQRVAVISFSAIFTAAAAAASRNVTIIVDDGANTVWQDDVSASITISQVATVNGSQTQAPAGIIATTLFVVLPPGLILPPGWRIRSSTANINAGDQWSAIWLNVDEFIDQI